MTLNTDDYDDFRMLIELARKSTTRIMIPSPLKEAVLKHLCDLNPEGFPRFWGIKATDGKVIPLYWVADEMYFDCGHPITLMMPDLL